MKFAAPANVLLRRAQLTLVLAALVPTVLSTAVGIVLLALGASEGALQLVSGVLVLAFATTAISGYILGSIYVSRGASLARTQNDFLSLVAHELRTPMTSIRLFIESLRDERLTDPEDKQRCLDLLHQEVERLDDLVQRLLELSRLETGRFAFEPKVVAIKDVLDEGVAMLQAAAVPEQVSVELSCDPELSLKADKTTLAQAVGNLLINAWKYTPADGRHIELAAEAEDGYIIIEVRDNGPGIPKNEQAQIFDKFERGQEAIDSGIGGTGLGLATVRAAVRAHKGTVELRSRAGRGSTFRIKLKRRKRP